MEALALKYRPRTFTDLVGQQAVQVILRQMVHTGTVHSALLFDGSRGTGKTTTARILAAALNCETATGPCGHCPSCKSVFDATSPDVVEIDAASNGLVDDIRALRHQVLYQVSGTFRVVILDEAHSMSPSAFNALLKTLEESSPSTVFILCTTEPARIPETVVSRCMPFTFKRIGTTDITARLAHICAAEQLTVEPELLHLIAERADGGMRDAVMTLDQVTRVGVDSVTAFSELMGESDYGPGLLGALIAADTAAAYQIADEVICRSGDTHALIRSLVQVLKELLILQAGGDITRLGDALSARRDLAQRTTSSAVVAAMTVLWDLTTKTRPGNPRSAVDLALALLAESFRRTRPQPAGPAPQPPRKLTLAEMAARQ